MMLRMTLTFDLVTPKVYLFSNLIPWTIVPIDIKIGSFKKILLTSLATNERIDE